MFCVVKVLVVVFVGVDVKINGQVIMIKGKNGELICIFNDVVEVKYVDNILIFGLCDGYVDGWVQVGIVCVLLNLMVIGVIEGFIKKLQLVGVGYCAVVKGNVINLFLGFFYFVDYQLFVGIIVECLIQIEIVLKGVDKQVIGQVAVDLCVYCCFEFYKGKGVCYVDEVVCIKEVKKK